VGGDAILRLSVKLLATTCGLLEDRTMSTPEKHALVAYRDQAPHIDCPYGNVQRIVTGGSGGVANVHVVTVTRGSLHFHSGYDEVYYLLGGHGTIAIAGETHALRPGAAVVLPAGVPHELEAVPGETLEFVIFGSPAMLIDDERAQPRKPA
jgi:mannose-6-phosphate isomerase-like protein (cupin superfamily)